MNPEQAVAVAKNVLTHLDDLNINNSCYLHSKSVKSNEDSDLTNQALFEVLAKQCTVCALGSCLLSLLRLNNKNYEEFFVPTAMGVCLISKFADMYPLLLQVFDDNTLCLIEIAFAGNSTCTGRFKTKPSIEEIRTALFYCPGNKTDLERLRLIMENVIRNHGVFLPS